jgi:hypothetical protein
MNEGEPSDDYSNDPNGSISIIEVNNNYSVTTLDFSRSISFSGSLTNAGFRIGKAGASFAADIEPEYITISSDSKSAWVTLQENNGVAKVDLASVFPIRIQENLLMPAMTVVTIVKLFMPITMLFILCIILLPLTKVTLENMVIMLT